MNAATLTLFTLVCFTLGYRFYGRYLARHIFDLSDSDETPAKSLADQKDFVPTKKSILWGHHFSSIAGAAPIVGPAVAVIWGWVPALLWIVFGTIFMGAVHDFGALVVSMHHKGQSLASISGDLISKRVRNLFLMVVLFLVWMVIAVFALVIANLFVSFPSSVIPVNFEILVALLIGYFFNRKGKNILTVAVLTQLGLFAMIYLGSVYPISLESLTTSPKMLWVCFLLIYSFVASILPVWALLQPRDYINSHQLMIGLGAIILGVLILQPPVVAPAFQPHPEGAPPWFPFLFITIACGAISGFHGLVSAGTTSKQIKKWSDAKAIGYGAMIGEGTLALLATLAVCAGFATESEWHQHYASWGQAQGLSAAINAFVVGSSHFLAGIGIPQSFGQTMMSVLIISFAATSLDTATRIQRYIITEVGVVTRIKTLQSPWVSAGVAVASAFFLMMIHSGGAGGLILWPLFGAANQMLAALTLVVICAFLIQKKKPIKNYFIPFCFIFAMTLFGLSLNIQSFLESENYLLATLASLLLIAELWIALEATIIIKKRKSL